MVAVYFCNKGDKSLLCKAIKNNTRAALGGYHYRDEMGGW